MKNHLNWILLLLIYLSVNGQVFATPVHICQAMAISNQALLSSPTSIKIHEHHQMNASSVEVERTSATEQVNSTMKSCHCVDCDCTDNVIGQANGYLLYSPLIIASIKTDILLVEGEQHFISQPHPNLFRPPIQY